MIVKFESPTCGPCRKLQAFLDKEGLTVEHINAPENMELVKKYNVSTLPTLIKVTGTLDDGKEEARLAGLVPPSKIIEFFKGE